MSRESALGLNFAAVNYYDGQGFIFPRSLNVTSSLEFDGTSVCVETATTTELNLADYFHTNNMKYKVFGFASADEALKAYNSGRCNVSTSNISQLHSARLKLRAPADHLILPNIVSKESLAPAVRFGDDQWLNIVKWTHFATVNAEELGVSSETTEVASKQRNLM